MKTKIIKIGALLLAALMLVGTVTACATPDETPADTQTPSNGETGGETGADETTADSEASLLEEALTNVGDVDYGGRKLTVLYEGGFKDEVNGVKDVVDAEGGTAQVINDAVYRRNIDLEERCNLVFKSIEAANITTAVQQEFMTATGDFQFIDSSLGTTATSFATSAYLADWNKLGIDLEGPWWDTGTADFVLNGGVYFMSGALNFTDDNLTYILIFNKDMLKNYSNIPMPYTTVRNSEWTLDYFNQVIQGISSDSDGKQGWDENDTYGFITTWEFGNTFFIGSGLRYVINDASVSNPSLYLSEASHMEKALTVLDLSCSIFHDNNATFMSPPGEESKGLTAFKENRGLFYSEVVSYINTLNADMKGDYGILPVPKYDKAQEHYNTWTFTSGSTFSIIASIPEEDEELLGQIMTVYNLLSYQHVKPAYYDTVMTTRNMRDPDSVEMMDMIFAHRIYEMGFYFSQLGCFDAFKECVYKNEDTFSSRYTQIEKKFRRQMERILEKLTD